VRIHTQHVFTFIITFTFTFTFLIVLASFAQKIDKPKMAARRNGGREVYIVGCVRTAFAKGRSSGALHSVHPVDLLATTLDAVTKQSGVAKEHVEDVIAGCVTPIGAQGANIARLATLKAGFPVTTPGTQVNRMCGSGLQCVHFASQAISSGDMDMVIGGGVEMMGTVRMGSDAPPGLFDKKESKFVKEFPYRLIHQGVSAELVAKKYGVSRQDCDKFAAESHRRMQNAIEAGYYKSQIVPVTVGDADTKTQFDTDECVRYPSNPAKLAKLPSVFQPKDGVVTAGNASQVSDGAAAVLLCCGKKADQLGLRKRARIVSTVTIGSDPTLMLDGVIPATRQVLQKANLTLDDIDVFEVNEAFASVVLAWANVLKPNMDKVNPNGGSIAHGHPLGATGAALLTKAVNELERTNGRYGLVTLCIGHGMAVACIIERVRDTGLRARL
jgi:acetyl-CoA acetyltransferase family protein